MRRRSILFVNRFYWPDIAATAQQLTDLAEDLAAAGWEVGVLTGSAGYDAGSTLPPDTESRRGVRIRRVGFGRFSRHGHVGRLVAYAGFLVSCGVRLLRVPKPDIVVALTDPPFLVAVVLAAGRVRGFRTVQYVQDLYPQLAAKLGVLPERGLVYRLLRRCAASLNRRCDAIITLGPRMVRQLVANGAPPERTAFAHNWADASTVRPMPHAENPFRSRHGLEGTFVVQYSGNAGRAHLFDEVLEAARLLRDRNDVVFLFIGGGQKLPGVRAAAEADALDNVRFLPYQERDQLRFSLAAADVALVTENPDVVGMLVPSKTYGILASGRPLLFVGSEESDVARIVRESRCGCVIRPGDGAGLATAILRLKDDAAEAAELGRNGRRAAGTIFDRPQATRRWLDLLASLVPAGEAHPIAVPWKRSRPPFRASGPLVPPAGRRPS